MKVITMHVLSRSTYEHELKCKADLWAGILMATVKLGPTQRDERPLAGHTEFAT